MNCPTIEGKITDIYIYFLKRIGETEGVSQEVQR